MGFQELVLRKNKFSKTFLFGLFVRLCLIVFLYSFLRSSFHFSQLDRFVVGGQDLYILELGGFSYPALMVHLFSFVGIPLNFLFGEAATTLAYILIIFLADLTVYLLLKNWTFSRKKRVDKVYWLSPVLIFINYSLGLVDVIPIAILFLGIHYLFKDRFFLSALFLGAALSTKMSTFIAYPFFIIYILFQYLRWDKKVLVSLIPLGVFLLVNVVIFDYELIFKNILLNSGQLKLLNASVEFSEKLHFLIIPALYLGLIIQAFFMKIQNRNIFMMLLGVAFGVVALFAKPLPGWFFGFIPFMVYFCLNFPRERGRDFILLFSLQLAYLVFFIFFDDSLNLISKASITDFVGGEWRYNILRNISFTGLQTVFFLCIVWLYYHGIREYSLQKMLSGPFMIGIGGNSGSGKSTLANLLIDLFGDKKALKLCGDDTHKWERGHKNWSSYTHLDPKANETQREFYYLRDLKNHRKINRRFYDHETGKFTHNKNSHIKAKNIIVYEGLHPFYIQKTRDLFDLKVFLKPLDELGRQWKIQRDTQKRGYSLEKILSQLASREHDYRRYIEVQEKYADIVIQAVPERMEECDNSFTESPEVFFKITCPTSVFLDNLLDDLNCIPLLKISHYFNQNDSQTLEIHGCPEVEEIVSVGKKMALNTVNINSPKWSAGLQGVMQLFICFYIMELIHDSRE